SFCFRTSENIKFIKMSTYSYRERQFAKVLNNMPRLKNFLKRGYAFLNYSLYGLKIPRVISDYNIHRVGDCLYDKKEAFETFWGYYDKYPMNKFGLVLLNTTLYTTQKPPLSSRTIHVLLFDIEHSRVLLDIETRTYNWQQGCRTHWLNDEFFILNDFDDIAQRYIARVYSAIQLKEIKRFNYPVQDSFGLITFYLLIIGELIHYAQIMGIEIFLK
ncbi:hypothetical protein, partial [Bacteroides stercorirosoris]